MCICSNNTIYLHREGASNNTLVNDCNATLTLGSLDLPEYNRKQINFKCLP